MWINTPLAHIIILAEIYCVTVDNIESSFTYTWKISFLSTETNLYLCTVLDWPTVSSGGGFSLLCVCVRK